jgi:hypothetical protein
VAVGLVLASHYHLGIEMLGVRMTDELHQARLIETYKSLISISTEGFKYLALINGGGLVALLSFAGSMASRGYVLPVCATFTAAGFLIAGLVVCGVTLMLSYKTQLRLWQEGMNNVPAGGWYHAVFLNLAFISTAMSIGLFALGACFGLWASLHPIKL